MWRSGPPLRPSPGHPGALLGSPTPDPDNSRAPDGPCHGVAPGGNGHHGPGARLLAGPRHANHRQCALCPYPGLRPWSAAAAGGTAARRPRRPPRLRRRPRPLVARLARRRRREAAGRGRCVAGPRRGARSAAGHRPRRRAALGALHPPAPPAPRRPAHGRAAIAGAPPPQRRVRRACCRVSCGRRPGASAAAARCPMEWQSAPAPSPPWPGAEPA